MPKVNKEKTEKLIALIESNFPELSEVEKRYISDQAYFYFKKKLKAQQTVLAVDPSQTKI